MDTKTRKVMTARNYTLKAILVDSMYLETGKEEVSDDASSVLSTRR